MRIGIDARMYGPKQGGLGRYIEQLITHLEKIDDRNEYVIFLRNDNWDTCAPARLNFKKIEADILWYDWHEQVKLPKIIKQAKVDLMHFPHWNVPLLYNDPFVVTIHDLLLLHYPTREASTLGPSSYWFKNEAFKKVLRHAVNRAKQIIVPSEFTKQDLGKTLGVPFEKINITYLAPFTNTTAHTTLHPPTPLIGERQKTPIVHNNLLHTPYYNQKITKRYALYVGVAYPHKNLTRLLEAWELFKQKYNNDYQLILVGKRNYFYNKLLSSNLALEQLSNGAIVFTDYLPDSDLAEIYTKASLYVFPSLYEGFGLPPLEAMQYDIPVTSSNRACLPEILQDAAFYFNPENTEEIVEALYRGFTDNSLRENLIANAKELLPFYSWKKTSRRTLEIYENSV